jgi:hypothetical protein
MSEILKRREIPTLLAIIFGIPIVIDSLFVHGSAGLGTIASEIQDIATMVANYTMVIGSVTVLLRYGRQVSARSEKEWYFRAWTVFLMLIIPIIYIAGAQPVLNWFMVWLEFPINVTLMALALLFYFSACFRTLRIKSLETICLMAGGLITLAHFAPLYGGLLIPGISPIAEWLIDVPYVAVARALVIVGGIAGIFTAVRVYLGLERATRPGAEGEE